MTPTELTPEQIVAMSDIIDKHYPNSDYVSYSDIRAMMTEYAASLNRQGWTRVEDGLPEHRPGWSHSESVNIYNGDVDIVSTGAYNYLTKEFDDYLYNNRKFKVTHWMKLPEPPK